MTIGLGAGLLGGLSGGVSATNYTNPLQLGKFADFTQTDLLLFCSEAAMQLNIRLITSVVAYSQGWLGSRNALLNARTEHVLTRNAYANAMGSGLFDAWSKHDYGPGSSVRAERLGTVSRA